MSYNTTERVKQHKHHKEIKAWADGAKIEWTDEAGGWYLTNYPCWDVDRQYRIKPVELG